MLASSRALFHGLKGENYHLVSIYNNAVCDALVRLVNPSGPGHHSQFCSGLFFAMKSRLVSFVIVSSAGISIVDERSPSVAFRRLPDAIVMCFIIRLGWVLD